MRDGQSSNGANAPVGSEVMAFSLPPTDDDAGLLILEVQFDCLIMELLAAQKAGGEFAIRPAQRDNLQAGVEAMSDHEVGTEQVEAILARIYPIEQAIMTTPACTIAGLGVKARHAAYVMSQYWEVPIDRLDWDAGAVRLLIEAVCDFAIDFLPGVELMPLAQPVPEGSIHRARLAAGTTIPVHTHPADEYVLVLSGTVETGGRRCEVGTFWTTPAGTRQGPHVATTDVELLTVRLSAMGHSATVREDCQLRRRSSPQVHPE